jgi:hydroxymethylpyrimidine pyrophosphatase-like HAD family hydrolase
MGNPWGPPRLIALDIDGTLTNGFRSPVSRRVLAGVRNAVAGGVHVVLATGRPMITTVPVLAELGLTTGSALCSNGAVRMDVASGELLSAYRFDPGPVVDLLGELLPGALFAVEVAGAQNLVTGTFPLSETATDRIVDHATLTAEPITRLTVYWPGHSGPEMAARCARADLSTVSCMFGPEFMVAVSAGISKGAALEHLRLELDVPVDLTMAVGDGDNDLEMLRWAGLGIAMGQAPDIVKAAAREICGTIDDDGLAAVLERWY